MLLQVLYGYAQANDLIEAIELTDRTLHLALVLRPDGSVDPAHAWQPLTMGLPIFLAAQGVLHAYGHVQ